MFPSGEKRNARGARETREIAAGAPPHRGHRRVNAEQDRLVSNKIIIQWTGAVERGVVTRQNEEKNVDGRASPTR